MIGDSGKPFELRSSGKCGRRLQGTSWEQVWMAGQTSPRCKGPACSPRAAATASCWTQERRCRAGLVESSLCPRCEEEDEDMHHRVWQCRANTGEIFGKTQHLIQKTTQAQNTLECFWLRGVPRSWTLQDMRLGFWREFGNGVLTAACTYIFGYGSGTQATRESGAWCGLQSLFRVCHGQTLECWKRHSERLMNSQAAGWARSARAKPTLWAGQSSWQAWWLLRAREATGHTSQTTRSSSKGMIGVGPHRDLGKIAIPISGEECPVPFTVQWQRAHVAAADVMHENHDMALVFGNEMADAMAKQAANEAALRGAAAEQVAWVDALAWQVQRRNLQASKTTPIVLTSCEKGLRRAQCKTVLHSLVEQTTHQLAFRRSRQRCECQVCKLNMGETSLVRWPSAGPCAGEIHTMQSIGNSLGLGVKQVRAEAYIPIEWKIAHPSHSVAQYRGITWCWSCAAWT